MIALNRSGPIPPPQRAPLGASASVPAADAPANRAARAVQGAAGKPLSRGQKTALALIALRAWEYAGRTREDMPDFETWRHAESHAACGRRISEAGNAHFSALKSHFLNLAGDAGRAFESAMREGTNDIRVAMSKLMSACTERGLDMKYPAAICWRQFKTALTDATAKQLWCLVFTVRNRRKVAPQPSAEGRRPTSGRDYHLKS